MVYMYNKDWYDSLVKSPLNPPGWVFGLAWTILYILMAVSFIITLNNKRCKGLCKPIAFFIAQLVLNLLWTTIFFRWKQIIIAFIVIILVIILTIITMVLMRRISSTGVYLLIPYIIWLCFAGYLNGYIMVMNDN
jgi:translocator protein|tara:strand:+ start:76 stop:480 length:405 start_codon:yes stop_codon:yes gene_type:complete